MGSAVGLGAVLLVLMVIYSLFFGVKLFSGDDREPTRVGMRYSRRGDLWRGVIEGVVLLFALAALVGAEFDLLSAIVVGSLVAVGAGLAGLVFGPGRFLIEFGFSMIGLAAATKLLVELFEDDGDCGGIDPGLRNGVVVALIVVWVLGLAVGVLGARLAWTFGRGYIGNWQAASGLALFGALDVTVLAAGPVGLGIGDSGLKIIFWGVAAIGVLTGVVPNLVLITCALALGLFSVVSTYTPVAAGCQGVGSSVPFAMILGYLLCAAVISRVLLGRARRQ